MRWSELIGQRALALSDASVGGTVAGIAVDSGRIVAVGLSHGVVAAEAVRSFEGDVVTYDDAAPAPTVTTSDPTGTRVLDMGGDLLGTLEDLVVAADGTIEHLVVSGGQMLAGDRLRVIGSYAAILTADAAVAHPASRSQQPTTEREPAT